MVSDSSRDHLQTIWDKLLYNKSIVETYVFSAVGYVAKPADFVAEGFTKLPSKYWESAFYLLLLVYTFVLLAQAWTYSSDARLFPFLIGVPLVVMSALYIILTLSPRYTERSSGLFDNISDEVMEEGQIDDDSKSDINPKLKINRELKMMIWTVALLALVYLVGFLNALAGFIFLFIYVYEKSLVRAIGITVLSIVFIQVFFVSVLSLTLWEGIVFSSILAICPEREVIE